MSELQFTTHTGKIVSGKRLENALIAVGNEYERMSRAIRKEDAYASHVTEEQKEGFLEDALDKAWRIRKGLLPLNSFWLWQRINTELTGECIGFLPKEK